LIDIFLKQFFSLEQYEHNQREMFGHSRMNGAVVYAVAVAILELVGLKNRTI
jgi:hypothetical protein